MQPGPPYIGAAYYPEGQTRERIAFDIRQMQETGINAVRIGEFAWSRMEPEDGRFDFVWLHDVVDALWNANIGVILCTPSATPPAWLTGKHPDILPMRGDGRRSTHGARLHYCPNNAVYRDYIKRINQRLAEEFAGRPAVIGWQVDNEVMIPFWEGCFCPDCAAGFRRFLEERYGTISALNEAWQLTLWSQEYSRFEEIPEPRPDVWHHPALKTAWLEYQEQVLAGYVEQQIDTLKARTDKPVSTDMMPFLLVDHGKMLHKADMVMFNHYNNEDSLPEALFWFDYLKTVKDAPLWNTETDPCGNGSTALQAYKPRGFCTVNSWLPFLFGGEANLYWHWRGHRAGQELMHGAVIDSYGNPAHTYTEICRLAENLKTCAPFLRGTRLKPARVAIHLSSFAYQQLCNQGIADGMDYCQVLRERFYLPLLETGRRVDIIAPDHDLTPYDVVLSPLLPCLDAAGLRERLGAWIEAGGVWIAGPLTDVRDRHCAKFDTPFGCLEEWGGVRARRFVSPNPRYVFRAEGRLGKTDASVWCDGFDLAGAEPLAVYGREAMELEGLAAVTENRKGKGRVVVLGTVPDAAYVVNLVRAYAGMPDSGVTVSGNVCCIEREGPAGEGFLLAEYRNRPGVVEWKRSARDLVTGELHEGRMEIPPYTVMAMRYI